MAHATKSHDYHLVEPSPWPLVASISVFLLALGALQWMAGHWGISVMCAGFVGVLYTLFMWWRDALLEARRGDHTPVVRLHLRYGMVLFIASEVMFFVAWFWAYYDPALFPAEIHQVMRTAFTGGVWPPKSVETLDPWHLPFLDTLILLTSGTTITWAHHALLNGDRKGLLQGLALTIFLGVVFSCVQIYEYAHATFAFHADQGGNVYTSVFFMATGFHGFHVFVGTVFLIICLLRALKGDFTPEKHFAFEAAAWYWHFVDVVWLFLFAAVYVWGAGAPGVGH